MAFLHPMTEVPLAPQTQSSGPCDSPRNAKIIQQRQTRLKVRLILAEAGSKARISHLPIHFKTSKCQDSIGIIWDYIMGRFYNFLG